MQPGGLGQEVTAFQACPLPMQHRTARLVLSQHAFVPIHPSPPNAAGRDGCVATVPLRRADGGRVPGTGGSAEVRGDRLAGYPITGFCRRAKPGS